MGDTPEQTVRKFIEELLRNLPEVVKDGIDITYSFFNGVFVETRSLNTKYNGGK